jgi:hypothetical protein
MLDNVQMNNGPSYAIYAQTTTSLLVSRSVIYVATADSMMWLQANTMRDITNGAAVLINLRTVVIQNNTFTRVTSGFGVQLQPNSANTRTASVTDNTFEANYAALYVYSPGSSAYAWSQFVVTNNLFRNRAINSNSICTVYVYMASSSTSVLFQNNIFKNNLRNNGYLVEFGVFQGYALFDQNSMDGNTATAMVYWSGATITTTPPITNKPCTLPSPERLGSICNSTNSPTLPSPI